MFIDFANAFVSGGVNITWYDNTFQEYYLHVLGVILFFLYHGDYLHAPLVYHSDLQWPLRMWLVEFNIYTTVNYILLQIVWLVITRLGEIGFISQIIYILQNNSQVGLCRWTDQMMSVQFL